MNNYSKELMHYGVMGMHWGIRRYQPYPAAYDGDGKFIGKKALKKKVEADKFRVDEATREASILGAALSRANKRRARYEKAYKKLRDEDYDAQLNKYGDPDWVSENIDYASSSNKWKKAYKKYAAAAQSEHAFRRQYQEAESRLSQIVKEMKNKYGNKNVRDIKYTTDSNGNKVVNERIISGDDWLASAAVSGILGTMIGGIAGFPLSTIAVPSMPILGLLSPRGRNVRGASRESYSYHTSKEDVDNRFKDLGMYDHIMYTPKEINEWMKRPNDPIKSK